MLALRRGQPLPSALRRLPDGSVVWTMPTGHEHVVAPPAVTDPASDLPLTDTAAAQLTTPPESLAEAALIRLLAS
jgi:hypothetical protein